ncbi:Fe-S cluster protein [Candidatus Gottesmanbacteria bacterium RIFCSPHIGHO2_01_FULL_39_10]|uniref:Fe-S cluster protein n=1 Tax=Candidatus Gottesmanbacteria bacterium RIFCSPHIGHO2_01_FULL_39_10 TaxID=1798375 RepID=A0A1F5ZST3_9BACT|nr:MAG: Fe-S cluster protein [Candidatus Gottesmanbacteria bacterium RIFCSPHIGHO2_01_FULL_39_10]
MDLYRDNILDHYKNPRNFGNMDKPDSLAEESNPLCGDKICIQIKLQTTNYKLQTIQDIKFSGVGCAISIASASLLTEKVKNMDLAKVQRLKTKDIVDMLGITLTPTRLKCALLSLEVLQKALNK